MQAGTIAEKKPSKLPIVALVVVIVILCAGFGYYYTQASSQIANLNTKLSVANDNLTSDQHEISVLNSNISTLQSTVSNDVQNIVSLKGTVQSDNSTIASLNAEAIALNENISGLNGNLEAEKSQVTSLNAQISQLQANETSEAQQITALNIQVSNDNYTLSNMQSQVSSLKGITTMSESTVELSDEHVTVPNSQYLSVLNFTASYPGYIVITSTAAGNQSFSEVLDQISLTQYSLTSGFYFLSYSSTSIIIPVGPGQINVYYGDTAGTQTALTITYYY